MITLLSDQLGDAIRAAQHRGVLGVYADPVIALQLARERDANAAHVSVDAAVETFMGYPLKPSPRPGLWLVLAGEDGRSEEILVSPGIAPGSPPAEAE